jgi:ABC-type nitrate/sulfonate/bicarbonate transport system ATPase subunit
VADVSGPGPIPLLEATDLAVRYGDREDAPPALAGIDLKVAAGESICLIGPSGCGKTTLLKAFGGFLPAARGGVLYRGRELRQPSRDLVMIFQEHNLYPWLTVEGNVAFGPRRLGVPRAERKRRVDELLRVVGLEPARRRYPHELSGGMRQRVAIARALATQPAALLLDEPFTALDVTLRRRMQQFLRDLWLRTGTTMLMVTHDIEEAILLGQRIVRLGGAPARIVETLDTSSPALKDRFSDDFRRLQAALERQMENETPGESLTTTPAPLPVVERPMLSPLVQER